MFKHVPLYAYVKRQDTIRIYCLQAQAGVA